MKVVNYDYIQEISTADALKNAVSDVTTWYNWEIPWVNTFKINAETSIYNEQWWWTGIAWWSTDINWTALDNDTVRWSSWSIYLPDWTTYTISSSGNTWNMSTTTYIYYDMENEAIATTTSASVSVGKDKLLLCVANPVSTNGKSAEFQAFWTNDQSTFIYASNIAANTITANEIATNTITANQIASWAITTDKIDAYSVTAGKIDVSQLSDIDPDLWSITAWNIKWVTITAWDTSDNWIKLYPYSSYQWRIEFYYNWSSIWYMQWEYNSTLWTWVISLYNNSYILLDWDVYMLYRDKLDLSQAKLRIPVGSDLY